MSNALNIGFILYPSSRAIAFLNVFKDLGVYPQEIIVLNKSLNYLPELIKESNAFHYSNYFDVEYDLEKFLYEYPARVKHLSSSNINENEVLETLENSKMSIWLYSGGGILKSPILSISKRFIHIHPGNIPDFRGSTCFYYSILEKNTLTSTSFWMEKMLDSGEVLNESNFSYNLNLHENQTLFMDHILDPYIRAYTLRKTLVGFLKKGIFLSKAQKINDDLAYFIIHPFLRYSCIKKVKSNFSAKLPQGIKEKKEY